MKPSGDVLSKTWQSNTIQLECGMHEEAQNKFEMFLRPQFFLGLN